MGNFWERICRLKRDLLEALFRIFAFTQLKAWVVALHGQPNPDLFPISGKDRHAWREFESYHLFRCYILQYILDIIYLKWPDKFLLFPLTCWQLASSSAGIWWTFPIRQVCLWPGGNPPAVSRCLRQRGPLQSPPLWNQKWFFNCIPKSAKDIFCLSPMIHYSF